MPSPLTPQLLQAFFQQLEMRFQAGYQRRVSYWNMFAELVPSGTETNVYAWLAELPEMRKWVGEKILRNIKARAYSLLNEPYEVSGQIDRDKLADDQAGIYARQFELYGDAANRWPEALVTKALIAGTKATGFDGQFFFDVDHPIDVDNTGLGTYSNIMASSALTATTYANAKARMRSFRGESGIPLQVQPTVLMVPPSLENIAKQIIKGELITQTVKNVAATENVAAAATSNVYQGDAILIINERLIDDTDVDGWYLFSTDRIKPMIFQQRDAAHLIPPIVDPTNPLVWSLRKFAYSVEGRGASGYSLPFLAIKGITTSSPA